MKVGGTLIPIGGNEEKGILEKGMEKSEKYTLEYIQDSILSRVVEESGGPNALIAIIPTASSIPIQIGEIYLRAFQKLGCRNIEVLDIRTREEAHDPKFLKLVKKADCIMFTGGNQSTIVKCIGETQLHEIILDRYQNESVVIAGTSAGAMCMSRIMIEGSTEKEVFLKGAVKMGHGLGFAPNFILDSHFIKRRRFGRLVEAMARFPKYVGIGLDENTGLVIKNRDACEIIGSGMVIIFDPRDLKYNDAISLPFDFPMSITNLKTHILASGDKFDIRNINIEICSKKIELKD